MNREIVAILMAAFPALIIGAITMYFNKIPISIFSQNIVGSLMALLISYLVVSKGIKFNREKGISIRVYIGPLRLYVASIVLPIMIIAIWNVLQVNNWLVPAAITISVSLLLLLQPDASQLTAFIIPMLMVLWSKTTNNLFRFSMSVFLLTLVTISWTFLDSLPPVSYVERIVLLAANMGFFWLVLGIISLAILPLPFIFLAPKKARLLSICLGIYHAIILISTAFGNFPVPLMGYGISPIIGYFISLTWLINYRINPLPNRRVA